MMRRFLRAVFGLALRVFFRRVEVDGAERVPRAGGVIFAVNHPNAFIDPLLLLCFAPRPVSVLAKAPLFSTPVVGSFVRAFDSIPVHRSQDPGSDLSRNRETFEAARRLLSRGGSLVLFPEGASHDDPSLRSLKRARRESRWERRRSRAHRSRSSRPGSITRGSSASAARRSSPSEIRWRYRRRPWKPTASRRSRLCGH